ncbi:MAG: M28 family peptidase [Bacteroidales bacterium]|nr:M28 family peptidase [Bacteroidales bacterium]
MYFLASDELQGRATGEPGLIIAGNYLAAQARLLGLKALDDNQDYFQQYTMIESNYDFERNQITIESADKDPEVLKEDFFIIGSDKSEHFSMNGEVVFAGYGIVENDYNYDDFADVDITGKFILIMNRAPLDESGKASKFGEKWNEMQNVMIKYQEIALRQAKGILLVMDPKSGFNSILDMAPFIKSFFGSSKSVKGSPESGMFGQMPVPIIIIHREVADQLLDGSGFTLDDLQKKIDDSLDPHSFAISNKTFQVDLYKNNREFNAPNVFGVIEGSYPKLKNEYVIYMAHYDHLGTDGQGGVFNGADDNASGSVALLEMAEAYLKEKKMPARSIGFLWVSGEEIGLTGSGFYANNPIIPLDKTVAAINLDMVGRIRTEEDNSDNSVQITVLGGDSIRVIGGLQSKVLMDINKTSLEEMNMTGDYKYNNTDHPARYFYRSDHISFAQKDIPILSYSTGTHTDYHKITDTVDKIDFTKFQYITRFVFKVGFNVANYKGEITVDNPFSSWE